MAAYHAKATSSLNFDLREGDKLIGRLLYQSWFKFNATIEIAQKNYLVEPKGFWGTTIEVKENEALLLNFKMNWFAEIIILLNPDSIPTDYHFKYKGVFKDAYVLVDHEGHELLVMKPDLRWRKMIYEYQIITTDAFDRLSDKELLLMISIHCANYYMSMIMSTG